VCVFVCVHYDAAGSSIYCTVRYSKSACFFHTHLSNPHQQTVACPPPPRLRRGANFPSVSLILSPRRDTRQTKAVAPGRGSPLASPQAPAHLARARRRAVRWRECWCVAPGRAPAAGRRSRSGPVLFPFPGRSCFRFRYRLPPRRRPNADAHDTRHDSGARGAGPGRVASAS
jgi:hypothetical protein